jgi:hypothetical protein
MIFNGAVAIGFLAAEWVILVTSLAPKIFTTAGPAMATCAGVGAAGQDVAAAANVC